MRILSSSEIKQADILTLEKQNLTSLELMERASHQFVLHWVSAIGNPDNSLIVCGPGNNGGDGLAVARILSGMSLKVTVFLPKHFSGFSDDYLANLKRLPEEVEILTGDSVDLKNHLPKFDFLCDALFGVGLNRPLGGEASALVLEMNSFKNTKVSLDVPSGLLDEMPPEAVAFEADWVGTFHSPKMSFLQPSNQSYVPQFKVIDIGLEEPKTNGPAAHFLCVEEVNHLLKTRKKFSHKGTYGHALIVAGSYGKIGAAVLASKAVLAVGAGLTTAFVPECGYSILQISVPEAMCLTGKGNLRITDLPDLGPYQSIGVGPGLGQDSKTAEALRNLMVASKNPLVLDADALNLLSENKEWLKKIPKNSILSPHPKEFERLAGKWKSDVEMLEKAKKFARKFGLFLLLKNAHTAVICPDSTVYFNSTGNPGMAKGGSGDVLTGMLTGLLAQGYTPLESSLLAVYLHGMAGDLAAQKYGIESFVASQLIGEIGQAFTKLRDL